MGSAGIGQNGGNSPTYSQLISGQNPSGQNQPLQTDNSGQLKISGSISATNPSVGSVGSTAPTQASECGFVDGSGKLQALSGTSTATGPNVAVTNFPASQTVSGSVSVSNFPASQPVTGTFWQTTQPVSGSVSVSNLPSTQNVSGTGTAGTPATGVVSVQGVSGGTAVPVSGSFWQATQPVSISGTLSTSDAANGPVSPGTAASKAELTAVQYNSSLPTATTGQQLAQQCDANGRILVGSIASALPTGANVIGAVTQSGTWNVGSITTLPSLPAGSNNIGTVSNTPTKGTLTDGSGTVGTTAATLMAVNASRKYLFIQNCSPTATIWINFTTNAVAGQPSIPLLPYAAFVQESGFVSTELISVIASAASTPYVAKQA